MLELKKKNLKKRFTNLLCMTGNPRILMLILKPVDVTVTLATSEMLSHAPPTREYFPSPILDKITDAESSGPTANGVCLKTKNEKNLVILNYCQRQGNLASTIQKRCSVQLMRHVPKGNRKFFLCYRKSSDK